MSLTFAQMKGLLQEIKPLLEGAQFDRSIAIGERKFILQFKNNRSLLVSLQDPFLRFHLTQHPWKEHTHPFSQQLNQSLHKFHLVHCELLQEDRILSLHFQKGDETRKLICEFIPHRANSLLLDKQEHMIASLIPLELKTYIPPLPPPYKTTAPLILTSAEIEENYLPLEKQAEFLAKRDEIETLLKQRLRQTQRACHKFENELEEALGWEKVQHEATLLQSHLFQIKKGMEKVLVNDWLQDNAEVEIKLDETLNPAEEVAKRFQKSKKLKRAVDPLKRQFDLTKKNIEKLTGLLQQLQNIDTEPSLKSFCQKNYLSPIKTPSKKTSSKQEPALPYREHMTEAGLSIWVGKSAKDNDKLTFSYARGSDYWLHAHDVPGSHVVLHLGKHQEPDDESLKDAIQAALFYSKAKDNQEGSVCITRCKHVARFGKNQPGKVQISQHRVVYTKLDLPRIKNLKERNKNYS
jgi:predicted ribosome quality control (RQC) complex YloA/Tae2 family protein